MNMKRFVAPSSREALRQVKSELGPDAVILSNRRTEGGVEVLAIIDTGAQATVGNGALRLALQRRLRADQATRDGLNEQFSVLRADIDNDIAAYRATAAQGTLLQGLMQVDTRYTDFLAEHNRITAFELDGRPIAIASNALIRVPLPTRSGMTETAPCETCGRMSSTKPVKRQGRLSRSALAIIAGEGLRPTTNAFMSARRATISGQMRGHELKVSADYCVVVLGADGKHQYREVQVSDFDAESRASTVGLEILYPFRCRMGSTAPSRTGLRNLFECHDVASGPVSASPSPTTQATRRSGLSNAAPNACDSA